MEKLRNNHLFVRLFVVLVVTAFSASGFCAGENSGRILPNGKVFIYKDGQKVGEFTQEAPVVNGALMECNGRCGVKLADLYLVAEDNSVFSISTDLYSRELYVKKGTVFFAVANMDRTLVFKTDHGSFTTRQVLLNASTDGGVLKGYVKTSAESAELGVAKGGSMVVSTFDGDQMIRPGNRIVLAQAQLGNPTVGGVAQKGSDSKKRKAAIAAGLVIATITALAVANNKLRLWHQTGAGEPCHSLIRHDLHGNECEKEKPSVSSPVALGVIAADANFAGMRQQPEKIGRAA